MPRTKLPNRRGGRNLTYTVKGRLGKGPMDYTALLGFSPQGRLVEVFFHCGKAGSDANILLLEMGIVLSFALQHGCPPHSMQQAMPRTVEGEPEGPLGTLLDLLTEADIRDAVEEVLS